MAEMARRTALALLAAAMTVSPGAAHIADPPAAGPPERPLGSAGLICVWAIYATVAEVGKRCGVARNAPLEAALASSVARIEAYARRRSRAGTEFMAGYRARAIEGDRRLCHSEALRMYEDVAGVRPEAVSGEADRLLATSPPVEWGSCL